MVSAKVQLRLDEEKNKALGELTKIFAGEAKPGQDDSDSQLLLKPSDVVRSLIPPVEFAAMLRVANEHSCENRLIKEFIEEGIKCYIEKLLKEDCDHPIDLQLHTAMTENLAGVCNLYRHFLYARAGIPGWKFASSPLIQGKFCIAFETK